MYRKTENETRQIKFIEYHIHVIHTTRTPNRKAHTTFLPNRIGMTDTHRHIHAKISTLLRDFVYCLCSSLLLLAACLPAVAIAAAAAAAVSTLSDSECVSCVFLFSRSCLEILGVFLVFFSLRCEWIFFSVAWNFFAMTSTNEFTHVFVCPAEISNWIFACFSPIRTHFKAINNIRHTHDGKKMKFQYHTQTLTLTKKFRISNLI